MTERHILQRAVAVIASAALLACTEPNRRAVSTPPAPELEARLELSTATPAVNAEVTVAVQLRGNAAEKVGSFTARVGYDTLALRFVGDETIADDATRVTNPQPGALRLAGIAPAGFTGGKLYAGRFLVLRTGAASTLTLRVDEMHNTTHGDLTPAIAVTP